MRPASLSRFDRPFPRYITSISFGLICLTAGISAAKATVPVYEGFSDYATGADVWRQEGGTGFSGPWDSRLTLTGS